MNLDDIERQKSQLEELGKKGYFTLADGTKSTEQEIDPKKRFGPDVLLPKRAASAYLGYAQEAIKKIRAAEGCSQTEAMKKAGAAWKELSAKEKKKYEAEHDKDQKRY